VHTFDDLGCSCCCDPAVSVAADRGSCTHVLNSVVFGVIISACGVRIGISGVVESGRSGP
jgi:hypothetical protein